ncbi:transposase [Pandoraea horticolens]|uniref:Transposase n=1 Tax=Pandoraea horticolens TaxID=2508298 RepID=A0A5E4YRI0_9BURK|nr:transposase [Pandoraea horticolens]
MEVSDARRLKDLVEREGTHANHKRVYRLYREAGLTVRHRRKRHGVMIEREQLALPNAPNEVWSIDFVMDTLANGRRLKCLTIVDDFTKEVVDIVIDHGISGLYVARPRSRCHRGIASGLQRAKAAQRTELPLAIGVRGETSDNSGCSCRSPGAGLKGLCQKSIGPY